MNCIALYYTDRKCDVSPYTDRYAPIKGVPIVSAATGYIARDEREYIFNYNQTLWMPELDLSLINPNQIRHFGFYVQDDPYADLPMTVRDHDRQFSTCLQSSRTTI